MNNRPKIFNARRSVLVALLLAAAYSGATQSLGSSSVVRATGERAVESEPHPGLALLLTEPLSIGLFSLDELRQLWTVWDDTSRAQAEASDEAARRFQTFSRYGLIERPDAFKSSAGTSAAGQNWEPLGYTLMDSGRFAPNCLTCHGGAIAGEVIPGLPNNQQDFAGLVGDLAALRAVASGKDPDAARASSSFGIPLNFVVGSTNATMYSILLGSMRDEHLDARFPPQLSQPLVHNSIDAPPWWHFRKKSRIYWDGMAPKSVRTLMQFAMAPGLSGEKIRGFEDEFKVIRDFIDQVEAPAYPFSVDEELAARGRTAFERVCSECHGTYGENETYPERTVPLSLLGTDPTRLAAIKPESKAIYNNSWFSNYGEHPVIVDTRGYVAPPLDGIWASAPYLHNASVPTLWHLLHPDQRPQVWRRSGGSTTESVSNGYDIQRVGLAVDEFETMPEVDDARERRQYFDASIESHSTAGHRFPDKLSVTERVAVLEYLKTL